MSDPMVEDTAGKTPSKAFKNTRGGLAVTLLRLKEGETIEEAIKRLTTDGWMIPSADQLTEGKDATSRYITLR